MKNKIILLNVITAAISTVALIISIKLFWNMGVFVDEFNTTPSAVYGGDFWLYMSWMSLGLLFILCVVSIVRCIKKI